MGSVNAQDKKFREWVQTQPCCICGDYAEYLENGDKRCHAAHVRHDSGIATKPLFSAVPLCAFHHNIQHNKSHTAIMTMQEWLVMAFKYLRGWLML